MTEHAGYTASELLAVMAARQLKDGQCVFAGVGIPLLAATLATPALAQAQGIDGAVTLVVPFTPGGLGLVETGMIALLMVAGVPKEQAAATALLDRTISYASIIVVGSLLFPFRRRL